MELRITDRFGKLSLAVAAFAALTFASAHGADTKAGKGWVFDMDQGSGEVMFKAIGRPSMLKIVGKGEAPKGKLNVAGGKVTGVSTFKLDTLDTGISMRTHHMKEKYLETGKFPEAKLTISEMTLPAEFNSGKFSSDKIPFKGKIQIHGVEKPVEGTAKVERDGDKATIEAAFPLKVSDFAIASPSFAGVTMAEDVEVNVKDTAPLKAAP